MPEVVACSNQDTRSAGLAGPIKGQVPYDSHQPSNKGHLQDFLLRHPLHLPWKAAYDRDVGLRQVVANHYVGVSGILDALPVDFDSPGTTDLGHTPSKAPEKATTVIVRRIAVDQAVDAYQGQKQHKEPGNTDPCQYRFRARAHPLHMHFGSAKIRNPKNLGCAFFAATLHGLESAGTDCYSPTRNSERPAMPGHEASAQFRRATNSEAHGISLHPLLPQR